MLPAREVLLVALHVLRLLAGNAALRSHETQALPVGAREKLPVETGYRIHALSMRGESKDMQVALRDIPKPVCPHHFGISNVGAFLEQQNCVQTELVRSDEELLRGLASILENQLLAILEARSTLEFVNARNDAWPKYIKARRAFVDTLSNLAPESTIETIARECASGMSEDIQKQRGHRFGDTLTEQAVFSLWTIRKVNELAKAVNNAGDPIDKDADHKLHAEYDLASMWGMLHLDLVAIAMKFKKTIPDDIQAALCEGLRIIVNVYAILKDAMALRASQAEAALVSALPWDEEDERLLALSMKDINADFSNNNH
jgi:hypothetical protein